MTKNDLINFGNSKYLIYASILVSLILVFFL